MRSLILKDFFSLRSDANNFYITLHLCLTIIYIKKNKQILIVDEGINLDEDEIKLLSEGNPEREQKLRIIILETEVLRQEGKYVPSMTFMKRQHWQELLNRTSTSARRKYLNYLFKVEKKKENVAVCTDFKILPIKLRMYFTEKEGRKAGRKRVY